MIIAGVAVIVIGFILFAYYSPAGWKIPFLTRSETQPTPDLTKAAIEAKANEAKIKDINSIAVDKMGKFRLLYSTIGYDSQATKHALVRTFNTIDISKVSNQCVWELKDLDKKTVLSGTLKTAPETYGLQLWEADFSSMKTSGSYYLQITMKIDDTPEILVSNVFQIKPSLLSAEILEGITLDNAEARIAPASLGGGYYDCNWSTMGEGYSHGVFLNGLSQTFAYLETDLKDSDKKRYIAASNIAFDYLISLIKINGVIDHQNPARPYYQGTKFGIMNSQEGLYGLAAYMDIFKGKDERANEDNYKKIMQVLGFVESSGPFGWQAGYDTYDEYLIPIYLHLYKYSGDVKLKDEAIGVLNEQLKKFDLRTMWRSGFRAIPMFEGLRMCVEMFPDHPDYSSWISRAKEIKDEFFYDIINRNAFQLITTSTASLAMMEWDDMGRVPMGDPLNGGINAQAASAYSMDACILGKITGDRNMEKIATGQLNWILGIHPGLPKWAVVNPVSNRNRESGALITGLPVRSVSVSYNVWKPANDRILSIVNGFSMYGQPFRYDNIWQNSENFIKWDGSFAYAICVYEDYLSSIK